MKPNFALSLSFSGIQLLQRQDNGWGRVGDVDIASADLTGDLADLLAKAQGLGSGPVQTKLIIPDDQIKYLTVDASGLDKDALQSAVLSALDGATPYAVDELEFDFANLAGKVHIAAVAKETLAEAEAFATEHGFDPIGFVAAPPAIQFPQEPNFGLTQAARAKGIDRLDTDMRPAIATGEARKIAEPEPAPAPQPPAAPITAKPDPAPEQVEKAASSEPADNLPAKDEAPEPDAAAAMGFASRRAAPQVTPQDSGSAPKLDGVQRVTDPTLPGAPEVAPRSATPPPPVPNAPQITGKSDAAIDETEVAANLAALRPGAADDLDDDIPPMPAGFARAPDTQRLTGAADSAPRLDLRPAAAPPAGAEAENGRGAELAAKAGAVGTAALSGVKGLFAKRAKAAPAPEVEAAQEEEKRRMTVFGARKPKKKPEPIAVGGKPRFLGLILTAILLLFLVSVAAWASVFLDEGLARFFGGADRTRAIAELPNPEAEPSDDELIELAALDSGIEDIASDELQEPLAQALPEPPVISPQEAEATYAATGIWLATPPQPVAPEALSLDDVYTASIDARVVGQDAFALEPLAPRRDLLPGTSAPPPPAGTDFTFGPDGLVVATPEGALTPEGAMVYLGRPAVVPPAIPQRLRDAALAAPVEAPEAASEASESVIAALRPKARPDSLIEDNERTQLGGKTLQELAKLRPKLRPKLEKEEQEAEAAQAPASALAVASSRTPAPRPRGFERTVARAQKQLEQQQEQQATQVAAVAPRAVTPKIPSKSSVAKAATVKNAINLSRVNLIGVYGKPSSRRALVRLSSGRYKKVKVGDRVDGGRVSAIGEERLIYNKNGRSVTLRMPKG